MSKNGNGSKSIIGVDLPILRHLTYAEAHLFIMGIWFGIDAAEKLVTGRPRMSSKVFSDVTDYIEDVKQDEKRPNLLPGFIPDAWYMVGGFIFGFFPTIAVVIYVVDSVVSVPGLISIIG